MSAFEGPATFSAARDRSLRDRPAFPYTQASVPASGDGYDPQLTVQVGNLGGRARAGWRVQVANTAPAKSIAGRTRSLAFDALLSIPCLAGRGCGLPVSWWILVAALDHGASGGPDPD